MMGLGKQNPGEAANGLGALDWERPATRGHDGPTVSTWTFLHAGWDPCIWAGPRVLVG